MPSVCDTLQVENEAKLGKVTAPHPCCLHLEGLALWTGRCVLNRLKHFFCFVFYIFHACVFNVCASVCRLRSVKMEQRKLSDQANTLVDLSKVRRAHGHTRPHTSHAGHSQ